MNKILKAAHSHFVSQRDTMMAELEVLINRDSSDNVVSKVINTIEKITIANLCINTVEVIIEDNKPEKQQSISELIAQRFNQEGLLNTMDFLKQEGSLPKDEQQQDL